MHGIHLKRSGNELSAYLAAEVALDAFDEALPRPVYQPTVIMIELQVVYEESAKRLQIASVHSIEDRAVQGAIVRKRSSSGAVPMSVRRTLGMSSERRLHLSHGAVRLLHLLVMRPSSTRHAL